jgi:hypothetical protein
MEFQAHVVFSLSAGIGALIGWVRFRKTDPAYLPFILLLTAGFVTELISIIVIAKGYSNAIYYNLFTVAEALLVTQLFYRLRIFRTKKKYLVIQFFYLFVWTVESCYRWSLTGFNSYFIVSYSAILVILSIDLLHDVLFRAPYQLYRNPVFLISMGCILYFTYSIIVELFWFYGLNQSSRFRIGIYEVFAYVNLFTNILFILATLWIPLKRKYILRSSSPV